MAHQQDADTSLILELEQEEKRHKEAVAAITAKYNKRKADDISNNKTETTSSEEIADGSSVKEEKKVKYEIDCTKFACDECDKHPKDDADFHAVFNNCATCGNLVCKDCVVTCEECGENYCKCVHEDDSK